MAKIRTLERYYGNNRAAKAIYGAILIFVFIATVRHAGETGSLNLAFSTFIAAISIVFAEIYAEIIGERIKHKGKVDKTERRVIINDAFAIAGVSIWPSLIFLMSATDLYGIDTAYNLALGYCLLVLAFFSYWANRMSGLRRSSSFVFSVVTVAVGFGIIWLKYLFGH